MKKILKKYFDGWLLLMFDELGSFYAWITAILAIAVALWVYKVEDALAFSILLILAIANIIACGWWKGEIEGTKKEVVQIKVYLINFVILIIIGCIVNCSLTPYIVASLIGVGIIYYVGHSIREVLSDIFLFMILSIVLSIILPLGGLIYFVSQTTIALYLKVVISVIYILITPLFSYLQDRLCACSVYELAKCEYDPEFEKLLNDKMKGE